VQQLREERKVLSPNLGGKYSRISYLDRNELSFGHMNNLEINEYLTDKAAIPLCPRCNDNPNVIKNGIYHSNKYGNLQEYYCKPCNYEFKFTPQEPKLMIECPFCGNNGNVIRNGIRVGSKGKKYQKYRCKDCNRHFRKKFFEANKL
jgi:transposase-like protein